MTHKLNWGILAAGNIAGAFAHGVAHSKAGAVVAVGSRTLDKAREFVGKHEKAWKGSPPRAHGSYEALLADDQVQAVYIATPHPMHAEWAIKAAEAGKHILCEKPLGVNAAQTMAIIEAAREHDVFLMEAFMYRCNVQTRRIVELIREGALGEVRMIHATFGFQAGFNPEGRLFRNDLAGGGILDVGCYPVSMARLVAGTALGRPFADPVKLTAAGHLGPTGVDEWAAATLLFENDIVAQVATSVTIPQENAVRIIGSGGQLYIPSPWFGTGREGGSSKLVLTRAGKSEEIVVETDEWLYGTEADTVAQHLDQRQAPSPAMSHEDTLGNMRTLDQWRAAIGLEYEMEKPAAVTRTVHGRPPAARPNSRMPYGMLPGLAKKVSRLVMGCDNQPTMPHAAIMWDDFFECGGTTFDTAYIYGGGRQEKLLGQWLRNRGIREQVVVITKGAHTPHCHPQAITRQLMESLDRLQSDHTDLYLMHRDNLEVPVGEFVEVLNEHLRAGRFKAFGGSNWTMERIDQANKYARRHGLTGFTMVSNNFSLARMVDPVWAGCVASSTPEFRAWHQRTQIALLSWSSQARGFFTDRAGRDKTADEELVRCWYRDDNFQRRERAIELARKKGCEPIQIALAYVLAQPFPTFALIGPRQLSETRSSLRALEVELSPEEVKWLNLEA